MIIDIARSHFIMSSSSSFASSSASKRSRPAGQKPQDAKKKRPFFECEICDLEFNSATNFAAHMKGKRHEETKKVYIYNRFLFLFCYCSKYILLIFMSKKAKSSSTSVVAQADVSAASDRTLTNALVQAFSTDLTSTVIEYDIVAASTQEATPAPRVHAMARQPLSDTFSSPAPRLHASVRQPLSDTFSSPPRVHAPIRRPLSDTFSSPAPHVHAPERRPPSRMSAYVARVATVEATGIRLRLRHSWVCSGSNSWQARTYSRKMWHTAWRWGPMARSTSTTGVWNK